MNPIPATSPPPETVPCYSEVQGTPRRGDNYRGTVPSLGTLTVPGEAAVPGQKQPWHGSPMCFPCGLNPAMARSGPPGPSSHPSFAPQMDPAPLGSLGRKHPGVGQGDSRTALPIVPTSRHGMVGCSRRRCPPARARGGSGVGQCGTGRAARAEPPRGRETRKGRNISPPCSANREGRGEGGKRRQERAAKPGTTPPGGRCAVTHRRAAVPGPQHEVGGGCGGTGPP